jgi:hypothetical protein
MHQPLPLWHKQLEIGDKFLGRCTHTGKEIEFSVIGYDRLEAKLNLAILSINFQESWPVKRSAHNDKYMHPSLTVSLSDKGLEILEYR